MINSKLISSVAPHVGAFVQYWHTDVEPVTALVTGINNDESVNLTAFPEGNVLFKYNVKQGDDVSEWNW